MLVIIIEYTSTRLQKRGQNVSDPVFLDIPTGGYRKNNREFRIVMNIGSSPNQLVGFLYNVFIKAGFLGVIIMY